MVKTIRLNGHRTIPDRICLGTYDSYGQNQIELILGAGWNDLDIIATFNAPSGKSVQIRVDKSNVFTVPPEATADKGGEGTIVFNGKQVGGNLISCNVRYEVLDHGSTEGTPPAEPTPDLVQQILAAASTAEKTAQSVRDDADSGMFTGPPGPPGPQGDAGEVETLNNLEIQEILNLLDK